MPDRFDEFFRQLDPDRYEADTGEMEAPVGWIGLIEVTETDLMSYIERHGPQSASDHGTVSDLMADGLTPGWYIVRINSDGLIWAMSYRSGAPAWECARADFAEAERTYAIGADATDHFYGG